MTCLLLRHSSEESQWAGPFYLADREEGSPLTIAMAAEYKPEPTVIPPTGFNPAEDAAVIQAAMKGFGTDEQQIIDILTKRTREQRLKVVKYYSDYYEKSLIEEFKSELSGDFRKAITALCLPLPDYMAKELNKAMKGLGTKEATLVEILCTHSNRDLKLIISAYERLYGSPLAEKLCNETSGDFRHLLTLILTDTRDESFPPSREYAQSLARQLLDAGELRMGTDERAFSRILAHESFVQLRQIFEEYEKIAQKSIEQTLQDELSGDLLDAMLAIVECVQYPPLFFAKRIHHALSVIGTKDRTLIRIITTRCEIDLGTIKKEFEKLYEKSLDSALTEEISGDYLKTLQALVGGP